jgi:hypothetical protein
MYPRLPASMMMMMIANEDDDRSIARDDDGDDCKNAESISVHAAGGEPIHTMYTQEGRKK